MRVTPTSSEHEFVLGEHTRLVVPVEQAKPFGGPAAPRQAAWIVEQDQPKGLADLEQLLDSPRSGLPVSMRTRPRWARNATRLSWSTESCSGKLPWSMTRAASSASPCSSSASARYPILYGQATRMP